MKTNIEQTETILMSEKRNYQYIEMHRIRSAWILLVVLPLIVLSCVALDRSVSSDRPFLSGIIAFLLIIISLSLLCLSMVLVVKRDKIIISILPIPFVMLKLKSEEISSFNMQRIRRPPRRPYDRGTRCFMARWPHGVLFRTSKGEQVLIGAAHPEDFMRAVWRLKKRSETLEILSLVDGY